MAASRGSRLLMHLQTSGPVLPQRRPREISMAIASASRAVTNRVRDARRRRASSSRDLLAQAACMIALGHVGAQARPVITERNESSERLDHRLLRVSAGKLRSAVHADLRVMPVHAASTRIESFARSSTNTLPPPLAEAVQLTCLMPADLLDGLLDLPGRWSPRFPRVLRRDRARRSPRCVKALPGRLPPAPGLPATLWLPPR